MDWDLYKTLEAVARLGSLTAAARSLGVSQSTVSRRLERLEERAGSPLLLREAPVRLTARGVALVEAIQPMVDAAQVAEVALDTEPELRGLVTVATVGELVRWVLLAQLGALYRQYPALRLELLADNRVHSLAAGEADLAIRMVRPERGDLAARRLRVETFGFFVGEGLACGDETPWISTAGSLRHIADQAHAQRAFASRPPRLLVEDFESMGRAVEAGLGAAVLPRSFASRLDGVHEVTPAEVGARDAGEVPAREVWLVVHRARQRLPRVRAVMGWIEEAFRQDDAR